MDVQTTDLKSSRSVKACAQKIILDETGLVRVVDSVCFHDPKSLITFFLGFIFEGIFLAYKHKLSSISSIAHNFMVIPMSRVLFLKHLSTS